MKIHRLLEITTLLLNKGTLTAKELSERFEVSVRTIYRDIEVLSEAGVPVYARTGHGGGICLSDQYTLNKTLISKQESESLIFALKTLQATDYPHVDSVLNKLGVLFKNTAAYDWVHIDFSQWGSRPNEDNRFVRIKDAIFGCKVVNFDYANANGESSSRSVEPMSIHFKGQTWYLHGFCRKKQDFRIFRMTRIKNLQVTDEQFSRRNVEETKLGFNYSNGKEPVLLRLKFKPGAMFRVFDDYDKDYISHNEDGTVEVCFPTVEEDWIFSYVFSFGDAVEVLEPQHIREKIIEKIKSVLKNYA